MDAPPIEDYGNEAGRDAALKDEAIRYIRAEPAAFFKRTAIKAVRLHERESIGIVWNEPGLRAALGALPAPWLDRSIFTLKLAGNLYWWLLLLAAAAGTIRLAGTHGLAATLLNPAVLIWMYFTAVHATTVIQDRYHFAAIPVMAMLAGVNACTIARKPQFREAAA
jgi:hypothetical protein